MWGGMSDPGDQGAPATVACFALPRGSMTQSVVLSPHPQGGQQSNTTGIQTPGMAYKPGTSRKMCGTVSWPHRTSFGLRGLIPGESSPEPMAPLW